MAPVSVSEMMQQQAASMPRPAGVQVTPSMGDLFDAVSHGDADVVRRLIHQGEVFAGRFEIKRRIGKARGMPQEGRRGGHRW